MTKSDLKSIVLSFERPKDSQLIGCEFLINEFEVQNNQISYQVEIIEKVTYKDVMEFLLKSFKSISFSTTVSEQIYSMLSAVITLSWSHTSIASLNDRHKEVLDFIKKTEEKYYLNSKKIEELMKEDSNVSHIIKILSDSKLLLIKEGEYSVREKFLRNCHLHFSEHTDKDLEIDNENINTDISLEDAESDVIYSGNIQDKIEKKLEKKNLNEKLDEILFLFKDKILYDITKEKQVDKLHSELQTYKQDVVFKATKPLVNSVIYIYDDMDKMIQRYRDKPEELDLKKMMNILSTIKEDIEILLEENGITQFSEEFKTKFNPKTQQLIKKILTGDKKKVGEVVEKIRPGFENATEIIRKERVAVYVYDEALNIEKENKLEGENDNE